jgi:biopolymer transport protein ExbD
MALLSGPSKGVKNDINVTPLVDVVLVLLIIFMVVTPMLHRGRDVRLPKALTTDETKKPDVLVISVPSDGTIWFETTPVAKEVLRAKVAESIQKDPERKILVKGDDALKVREIRTVMAEVKAAGAKGISFAVEEVKR